MTHLSCHRFRGNEAPPRLSILACNLGNLWRQLVLPKGIESWFLTSLQQLLVKTGGVCSIVFIVVNLPCGNTPFGRPASPVPEEQRLARSRAAHRKSREPADD